jgi:hypothetical protein
MKIIDYKLYSKKVEKLNDRYWLKSKDVRWNCPDDLEHHMIDDDKISIWTDNLEPIKKQIKSGRIILTFKF